MDSAREKGSSLIEVVIALLILLILMVGILQMFSMAFASNMNAGATTDLIYKAQQTAEILKYAFYQQGTGGVTVGLPSGALDAGTHTLPASNSDAGWDFWGPEKMGVVDRPGTPYEVRYTVADAGADWTLVVSARPRTSGGARYVGAALKGKVVEYAVQIPKAAP
jgi:type II secretory pathway pseudopilin PulG